MGIILKLIILLIPCYFVQQATGSWILGVAIGGLFWSIMLIPIYLIIALTNFLGITNIDLPVGDEYPEGNYDTSYSYDNSNTNYNNDNRIVHTNTISEVPEAKKYQSYQGFVLKVRLKNDKYSGLQEIVISARSRQEARRKAMNLGYTVIQCT